MHQREEYERGPDSIIQMLANIIVLLKKRGITIQPGSRIQRLAIELQENMDNLNFAGEPAPERVRWNDLTRVYRDVWELLVLCTAMDVMNMQPPEMQEYIHAGTAAGASGGENWRDVQLRLYAGAMFLLAGMDVQVQEGGLNLIYEENNYPVLVKRVSGLGQLEGGLAEASAEIDSLGRPGLVQISLEQKVGQTGQVLTASNPAIVRDAAEVLCKPLVEQVYSVAGIISSSRVICCAVEITVPAFIPGDGGMAFASFIRPLALVPEEHDRSDDAQGICRALYSAPRSFGTL